MQVHNVIHIHSKYTYVHRCIGVPLHLHTYYVHMEFIDTVNACVWKENPWHTKPDRECSRHTWYPPRPPRQSWCSQRQVEMSANSSQLGRSPDHHPWLEEMPRPQTPEFWERCTKGPLPFPKAGRLGSFTLHASMCNQTEAGLQLKPPLAWLLSLPRLLPDGIHLGALSPESVAQESLSQALSVSGTQSKAGSSGGQHQIQNQENGEEFICYTEALLKNVSTGEESHTGRYSCCSQEGIGPRVES